MPDTVDVLCLDSNPIPIVAGSSPPIDMLGRHEIVSQIMALIDSISSTHGSCTFALNGSWGSGKTFVLDMLEQQLCDHQAGEKYIVFHYNCWKYDYYEEPLVAIVSAMFDGLDEQTRLMPQSVRDKLTAALPTIAKALSQLAIPIVKSKLSLDGLDLSSLSDILLANGESQYDHHHSFNKAINKVKEELGKLAEDKTIVVVVDELDRCLPDYAIKVLERLHHLFDKLPNTVVALAIDRGQLENAIKQIFGKHTDTAKYLKKFINFEFQLSKGEITGSFSEKYINYVSLFDSIIDTTGTLLSMDEYFSALFDGIDIRTQEQMLSRLETAHRILFPNTKKDYCLMYLELLLIVHCTTSTTPGIPISFNEQRRVFVTEQSYGKKFKDYVTYTWAATRLANFYPQSRPTYTIPSPATIPEAIVYCISPIFPNNSSSCLFRTAPSYAQELDEITADLSKIYDLLHIIQ